MLKIKDDVDLKELEKFGFTKNSRGNYDYRRYIDSVLAYRVYITKNHHYIQIQLYDVNIIAGSLQKLIYDLIKADLVEVVE